MSAVRQSETSFAINGAIFPFFGQRGAMAALLGFVASSALATGASPMEGAWGGADAQGRTAQSTIVGNQVIGVFWGQDYHDAENLRWSRNGARLDFTIGSAKATFMRDFRSPADHRPRNGRPGDFDRLEEGLEAPTHLLPAA
jgi:hypothetical protein